VGSNREIAGVKYIDDVLSSCAGARLQCNKEAFVSATILTHGGKTMLTFFGKLPACKTRGALARRLQVGEW
jgi:hypothetical protein